MNDELTWLLTIIPTISTTPGFHAERFRIATEGTETTEEKYIPRKNLSAEFLIPPLRGAVPRSLSVISVCSVAISLPEVVRMRVNYRPRIE